MTDKMTIKSLEDIEDKTYEHIKSQIEDIMKNGPDSLESLPATDYFNVKMMLWQAIGIGQAVYGPGGLYLS